ncbi:hypothetical protein [Bosea sp. Tri-44]|nr:hypothetical protein [Bosea sp. Tri-44]
MRTRHRPAKYAHQVEMLRPSGKCVLSVSVFHAGWLRARVEFDATIATSH